MQTDFNETLKLCIVHGDVFIAPRLNAVQIKIFFVKKSRNSGTRR